MPLMFLHVSCILVPPNVSLPHLLYPCPSYCILAPLIVSLPLLFYPCSSYCILAPLIVSLLLLLYPCSPFCCFAPLILSSTPPFVSNCSFYRFLCSLIFSLLLLQSPVFLLLSPCSSHSVQMEQKETVYIKHNYKLRIVSKERGGRLIFGYWRNLRVSDKSLGFG